MPRERRGPDGKWYPIPAEDREEIERARSRAAEVIRNADPPPTVSPTPGRYFCGNCKTELNPLAVRAQYFSDGTRQRDPPQFGAHRDVACGNPVCVMAVTKINSLLMRGWLLVEAPELRRKELRC